MERMRSQKFDKAYKKVLTDSRNLRKLGGYGKVGDYRDVVNDASLKVWCKYGEKLFDLDQIEVVKLIVQSMKWCRLSKMRSKKDLSSQYLTNYISEFENFDEVAKSSWEGDLELTIDSSINNMNLLPLIVEGYNSKDYMDQNIFKTKRVALYQTQKQIDNYKSIILRDEQTLKEVLI